MATHEKVDVAVVGAGASGSVFAAVLAKAGKKVVVLETGPDWQLSDLMSSDFWGRRIKAAGAPFLLEGKNPFGYGYQSGWGVGGAALHYFANLPRLLPNDFKIRSEHNRALGWPASTTAGAISAVRPARSAIRWSPTSPRRARRAPKSGRARPSRAC